VFSTLLAMAHPMEFGNGSVAGDEGFQLILVDLQQKLVSAWQEEMAKELGDQSSRAISVTTYEGYFQQYVQENEVDCLVSPANSFGLMDGGLDLAISNFYGGVAKLVPVVRSALIDECCGQQNVGTCLLVDVQQLAHSVTIQTRKVPRYIAHVPTMRVPKLLNPEDDIVYRCTWALLTAVRKHNMQVARNELRGHGRINSVLCSGFGTGAGHFPAQECARQMVLAVKHFAERSWEQDDLQRSSISGLLTLWEKAEKIEDAVCSFVKPADTPSSPNIVIA